MAPIHGGPSWPDALRWVLTQPGLLRDLPGGSQPLLQKDDPRLDSWMTRLKSDSTALNAALSGPRSHKPGIVFENLVQWGLENLLDYQCLARDLQITVDGRTAGALDLVLRSPQGAIEHWELAYKLFLQSSEGLEWASWMGPGRRDRLDLKVRKMLMQQLPLSERPEATERLQELGIGPITRRRALLQGVLFSPWDSAPCSPAQGHRPAMGRWLRPSQIEGLLQAYPESTWSRREKPRWFGPWQYSDPKTVTADQFRDAILDRPLLHPELWARASAAPGASSAIIFIVPETWDSP